jgi:hypothetical protein
VTLSITRRWLFSLVVLAGCRGSRGPKPVCDGVTGMAVTRIAEHPGGGEEVTARLRFQNGVPIAEADLVECISIEGAPPGNHPAASIARRPVDVAYTLLLVDPGTNRRENENARGLVEAILKKRPASEAIALFRWGAGITQIAPFNDDRRLLLERLSVGLAPSDGTLPAAEALGAAATALDRIGGPARDALRTVVLVNPRAAATAGLPAALDRAQPHLVAWIGGAEQEAQLSALPAGLRFPIGSQTVPALVVSSLSDRLDAYMRHAHYAVGVCGQAAQSLQLRFREGETTPLTLPAALPENRPGLCQPDTIAHGQRVFSERLELVFTPEERAAAAAAHEDEARRPPFALSVRVAADAPATRATARYRGGASYGCRRRSYSLELDGEAPRFLFRGSAARRFELVAMCLDRLYLRTFTILHLLAEEGLFPIPFDLIEVTVDGVSQGPYLVLENVSDALRVHSSRLNAVVRRLEAPGGTGTEVRWSATSDADAQAGYDRILAGSADLTGRRLEDALGERLDLQAYLTWVALMNLVGSGGYSDEVVFYSTETAGTDGSRADYNLMMGWDEDDVFTACRASGQAIVDPRGLVTCAQAALDRRIFSDSLLYARYAEVLSSVLERHSTERFSAFARGAAARVLTFLEKPDARAGLVELRAINSEATSSFEVARDLLEGELAVLVSQFDHHRETLADRLDRFRGER